MTGQIGVVGAGAGRALATNPGRRGYGGAIRRLPGNFLFLVSAFPVGIVGFTMLVSLLAAGVATAIVYVGVGLLIASLHLADALTAFEARRLEWTGRPAIGRHGRADSGPILTKLRDSGAWRRVLYALAIVPLLSAATWSVTIGWAAGTIGGLTYWTWSSSIPPRVDTWRVSQVLADMTNRYGSTDLVVIDNVLFGLVGLLLATTLPVILDRLTDVHAAVVRWAAGA